MKHQAKRVLLIDDHPLCRIGLRETLLGMRAGIVVHEAGTVFEALKILASQSGFDLIVYDWRLANGGGGRKGLLAIAQSAPSTPLLVLSGVENDDARQAAEGSGAADFMLKTGEPRALCDRIQSLLRRGESALHRPSDGGSALAVAAPALTPRQQQVLKGMAQGSENKVIADDLEIAETTVRGHVSDILRLMKVRNHTRAVVLAARWGLV